MYRNLACSWLLSCEIREWLKKLHLLFNTFLDRKNNYINFWKGFKNYLPLFLSQLERHLQIKWLKTSGGFEQRRDHIAVISLINVARYSLQGFSFRYSEDAAHFHRQQTWRKTIPRTFRKIRLIPNLSLSRYIHRPLSKDITYIRRQGSYLKYRERMKLGISWGKEANSWATMGSVGKERYKEKREGMKLPEKREKEAIPRKAWGACNYSN